MAYYADLEGGEADHLHNKSVSAYSWSGCSVHVKDHARKGMKTILQDVEGLACAGAFLNLSFVHLTSLIIMHRRDARSHGSFRYGHPVPHAVSFSRLTIRQVAVKPRFSTSSLAALLERT
jgi:hypothetical protein